MANSYTKTIKGYYFWKYFKKRKNEAKRRGLPKSRISRKFNTKKDAISYLKKNKSKWVQGGLYFRKGLSSKQVAALDTKGKYREKYF